jgi:hypothetical protein
LVDSFKALTKHSGRGIVLSVALFQRPPTDPTCHWLDLNNFNPYPYDAGFDIEKVIQLAVDLPSHSWEFRATSEALIELENPQFSVFGVAPFPVANVSRTKVRALDYVAKNVRLGGGRYDAFDRGNGAAKNPMSMGVFAVMLGKRGEGFANAAKRTAQGLLEDVPRMPNGAISHRSAVPEVW